MLKKTLLLLFLLSCSVSYAETVSEDEIKSAFIFHFLNFTEWPDNLPEYNVCIPDNKPLRDIATQMFSGKAVNNHPVVVLDQQDGCQVLVSDNAPYSRNMLTIGSLNKGALMEFRTVNNKLKFAVNLNRIKSTRFKISSQLLKLAILE